MTDVKKVSKKRNITEVIDIDVVDEATIKRKNRTAFLINAKNQGLSRSSIVKAVNAKAEEGAWDPISERTLSRDIAVFYNESSLDNAEFEELNVGDTMRLAHIEALSKTVEKLIYTLDDVEKNWKPFEKQDAIKKLFDMQDRVAQLENWDKSKIAEGGHTFIKNELNIFQDGSEQIGRLDDTKKNALLNMLDTFITNKKA